jgi:RecG-like helicase
MEKGKVLLCRRLTKMRLPADIIDLIFWYKREYKENKIKKDIKKEIEEDYSYIKIFVHKIYKPEKQYNKISLSYKRTNNIFNVTGTINYADKYIFAGQMIISFYDINYCTGLWQKMTEPSQIYFSGVSPHKKILIYGKYNELIPVYRCLCDN